MLSLVHSIDDRKKPLPRLAGEAGRRPLVLIESLAARSMFDAQTARLLGMVVRPRESMCVSGDVLATTVADAFAEGFWPLALVSGRHERAETSRRLAELYPIVVAGSDVITPSPCWLEIDERIELRPMTATRIAAVLTRRHVIGATIDIAAHPNAPLIDWIAEALEPALGWRAHLACL